MVAPAAAPHLLQMKCLPLVPQVERFQKVEHCWRLTEDSKAQLESVESPEQAPIAYSVLAHVARRCLRQMSLMLLAQRRT